MKHSTVMQTVRDDRGWVIVPVLALMVIALGLGFALLAVVDTQTAETREKRANDAAQTFSEGVVAVTASVMATRTDAGTWRYTGACQTFSHRLADTDAGTTLEAQIVQAVHDRFAGSSSDLTDDGNPVDLRRTTWTATVCPVGGNAATTGTWDQTAESWSATIPGRTLVSGGQTVSAPQVAQPVGTPPQQLSMWIRAQGNVQSLATTNGQRIRRSRAVVSKVRQVGTNFVPDPLAVASGGMSTALTSNLSHTLFNTDSLIGGLTHKLIGTKPLISGPVGSRCALLDDLDLTNLSTLDLNSLCLNATLGGLLNGQGTVEKLGLGAVNSLLGISGQQTLETWAVAPPDALASYAEAAKRNGTYYASVGGYGNDKTKSTSGTNANCVDWTAPEITSTAVPATSRVIYIKQVGDGEQYCSLTSGTAAIVIVERGAIRVTGGFKGVVYGANLQECGADGVCTPAEREAGGKADGRREIVRVDGPGTVTGAVWADGAGGQVGIYPPYVSQSGGAPSVLDILGATRDTSSSTCSSAPVGLAGVVSSVGSSLGGLLGNLLGILGIGESVVYTLPDGSLITNQKPTGCQLLVAALKSQSAESLAKLLSDGGDLTITVQTTSTKCFLGCSTTTGSETTTVRIPAGGQLTNSTGGTPPNPVTGILGMVTSSLSGYQAIALDTAAVTRAGVVVTSGGSPVVGSYKNVSPEAGF
ncbi:hypothetical protein [Patulibacter sp.]|uniref:hypothetical protein n=1 Tax=Patulibacter sp. TaxID=1912859 RepID=UPI0027185CB8|nr:hypothetical protein [Patulibacter sp.]MDO9407195.1 hypothetical protein [Patulibacter sp.]